MLLDGVHLPLTTPFHPDGRLNLHKLEYNVDRYSRTPVAGLVLLSEAGEGGGLTDAESREVLRVAAGTAGAEKVLLAEVGRESVVATLEMAEAAAKADFDAVLIGAPALVDGIAELRTFFQVLADRSPLPVVLVSKPGRVLSVELVAELAAHPGVLGIVDSDAAGERLVELLRGTSSVSREVTVTHVFAAATGRMRKAAAGAGGGLVSAASLGGGAAVMVAPPVAGLKTRVKRVGFQVLAGRTAGMLAGLCGGVLGAVPRFGVCAPQAVNEVFQAWKDGDEELAREKQERVAALGERMEGAGAVAAIKYGCDLNGYFGGRPRLPLLGLTGEERTELEREMAGLRN